MPNAAPKPCLQPGCRALVRDGTSRCPDHKTVAGSFADKRRGSRHERGYGTAWDKTRARILKRDAGLCQPSLRHGLVVQATAVDHKVPKARGGTDDDSNLQAIGAKAHAAKTAAERLSGQIWDEAAWFADQAARESRNRTKL
jgi:5-methylcytosine-specific restriction protein A